MNTLIVVLIIIAVLWQLGILGSRRRSQQTHDHPRTTHRSHRPHHSRTRTHPDTATGTNTTSTDGLTGDQILLLASWVCAGLWYTHLMGGDPSCLFAPLYGMGLTLDQ